MAPDDFAFLIYTSGATGQPKGVIQNHRNLLHDTGSIAMACIFVPTTG